MKHNNRIKFYNHEGQGFTLIELMIYGVILGMFLMVMTTMFTSMLDMQLASQATSAIAQDSRYIFSRLSFDFGKASEIIEPATIGNQGGVLRLDISGVTHTYSVNNGNLELSNDNGVMMLNSVGTVVSGVSFRRIGNPTGKHSVRIGFTLTSVVTGTAISQTGSYQTTIALR